jgi:hypothetical protein
MSIPDQDVDQDPVWELVDQVEPAQASPLFSRNVLREIRLSEDRALPWWKRFLSSKPLVASSLAGAAAVAILLSVGPDASSTDPSMAGGATTEEIPLAELSEELDQELLIAAAEDPDLFSDEQLLALLY